MTKLGVTTLAWRNFLYANPDGYYNNPKEIMVRVSQIQDEREAILNQMLKEEPDMNQIQMSKEEMAFQIEQLKEITEEFSWYTEGLHGTSEELQSMILDDFKNNGTESNFYKVAEEWKICGENADRIVQNLKDQFGYVCDVKTQEYLLQQMMDLQMQPEEREEMQRERQFWSNWKSRGESDINLKENQLEQQIKQEATPTAESNMELAEEMSEEELMLLEAQADQGMILEP